MATVTRTHVFVDGDTLTAAQLNAEFNNLLNAPAIMNSDVASNAAIASSKLSFGGTSGQHLLSDGSGGLTYSSLTINRGIGFFSAGTQSVTNDLSWDPVAPQAMTAIKLWVYAKTAPVGSSLTIRIYNVTQAAAVATVSISSGSQSASTTSMTTAAISAGDVLRFDITAIGSTTPGSDVTAILECTQP